MRGCRSSSELSIQNTILESMETRREEHASQLLLNNDKIEKYYPKLVHLE